MSGPFVHLRLHSEFSVVDGLVQLDEVAAPSAADGQGAIALTDSASMFGTVRFYNAARAQGVKPIIGVDAWIAEQLNPQSIAGDVTNQFTAIAPIFARFGDPNTVILINQGGSGGPPDLIERQNGTLAEESPSLKLVMEAGAPKRVSLHRRQIVTSR